MYVNHILRSLGIAKFTDFKPGSKILDMGTGGGFPGIPLAVMFPDVQFHLVDRIGKKIKVAQDIADRIGLERTYFSNLFKKEMGISPKKYLLKHRMEQAADLIKNRGYSVSVTALSVGYSDVYIFSKMFKQYYGVSPSKFKKIK